MPSMSYEECCQMLEIQQGLTAKDIRTAYRKLALKTHPDKAPSEDLRESYAEKFKQIQEAFETLSDHDFKKFGTPQHRAEDVDIDPDVGNYSFVIKKIDGSIDEHHPEQRRMLDMFTDKMANLKLRFDNTIHYDFVMLSNNTMLFLNALNNSYLSGDTEAEKNINKALVEICNNVTLLCEKSITAIEYRHTSAIRPLVLDLVEVCAGLGKAIRGLNKMQEKTSDPTIDQLKKDLHDSGIEATSILLQTYSAGFARQVKGMHIDRNGYKVTTNIKNEDFKNSRFELADLGRMMENIKKNNFRDLKTNINNLKWDTTYWKKFKNAAVKLLIMIADKVNPHRKKTHFDTLSTKGMFAGASRQLSNTLEADAQRKKHSKK